MSRHAPYSPYLMQVFFYVYLRNLAGLVAKSAPDVKLPVVVRKSQSQ